MTAGKFKNIRDKKNNKDVTAVASDGRSCTVHRNVLTASSPYFKVKRNRANFKHSPFVIRNVSLLQGLLEGNENKNPVIVLRDVPYPQLTAILEFMYTGEVNIGQDQMYSFIRTGKKLRVKGLSEIRF